MKKILLTVAFTAIVLVQTSFAQDSTPIQLTLILKAYFSLEDALVSGNATIAANFADSFARILSGTKIGARPETASATLLRDAQAIAAKKDLELQRAKFASLSSNMVALVKNSSPSPNEVYHQYCPMKKSSWISNSKAIKNPYYGSAMLTCGIVKEIL